jgi:hypothetical protein
MTCVRRVRKHNILCTSTPKHVLEDIRADALSCCSPLSPVGPTSVCRMVVYMAALAVACRPALCALAFATHVAWRLVLARCLSRNYQELANAVTVLEHNELSSGDQFSKPAILQRPIGNYCTKTTVCGLQTCTRAHRVRRQACTSLTAPRGWQLPNLPV